MAVEVPKWRRRWWRRWRKARRDAVHASSVVRRSPGGSRQAVGPCGAGRAPRSTAPVPHPRRQSPRGPAAGRVLQFQLSWPAVPFNCSASRRRLSGELAHRPSRRFTGPLARLVLLLAARRSQAGRTRGRPPAFPMCTDSIARVQGARGALALKRKREQRLLARLIRGQRKGG